MNLFSKIFRQLSIAKFVICLVCNAILISSFAQGNVDYDWKQVPIGGGGYIIGMKIHPLDGDVRYFRTDIGGAYRWNKNTNKLDQLLFFGYEKTDYFGVGGIALDPNNPNRLILAVGRYCDPEQTAILVSNDKGLSWSKEIVPGDFGANIYFASNGGRGCDNSVNDKDRQGAPIVLNPNDPNELLIGSRGSGLWSLNLTTENFTQLGSPVIPNAVFPHSIRTLEFHPVDDHLLYIAYAGEGIFRADLSNDTYQAINTTADLKEVSDLSISRNGDYMLLACKRKGIYKATNIISANPNFNKVLNYTGVNRNDDEAFLTVTCSPDNNDLAVTAFSDWQALSTVRFSYNSGNAWTGGVAGQTFGNLYPWHTTGEGSHISQFRFDPDNINGLYFTSWFTTYYTDDFTANPIQWTNSFSKGHEEAVITDIVTFPKNIQDNFLGITGGDQTGFLYSSIDDCNYPSSEISDQFDNDVDQIKGASMDYCFSDSDYVVVSTTRYWDDTRDGDGVVTKENTGNIFRSTDGGASFIESNNYDETLGKSIVAVASDNSQRVVIVNQDGLWYSTNQGATFTHSQNATSDMGSCTVGNRIADEGIGNVFGASINTSVFSTVRSVAGDKVLGCVFYFYDRNDGSFHVSTDYGETFFKVYDGFPDFVGNKWRHKTRVTPVPNHAKHVWINFKDDLYYTTNAGENWTRLSNVQNAETFAIGKQMGIGSYPTIFLFGIANNDQVYGYYRSVDMGASWNLIHDPIDKENWGSVKVMGADMEQEGRVYFSAGGLGLIYGDDTNVISNCDDTNLLSNYSFENGLTDWEPRTGGGAVATFNAVNTPAASDGSFSAETNVISQGNNYWDIQVKRNNIFLNANTEYKLSFDARTLTGNANMRYGSNTSVGNNFVMAGTAGLSSNWTNHSIVFTPSTSENVFLAFNYGDLSGTFYLDNVRLAENCPCEDSDNDTVCDDIDMCSGFDDLLDANGNGIPDGCESSICELVENGDFENGLTNWELKKFSGANGNVSVIGAGIAKIDITNPSSSNWHLGLRQSGILLRAGETYEVNYTAYADANRDIDIIITNTNGSQYSYHVESITTASTNYVYQFTMGSSTNSNALVNVNVATNSASVYIDEISIENINCEACIYDLELNDQDIFDGIYQVETLIESNGKVVVPNHVIFKAAEVLLESDFEVVNSTTFEVILQPCQ